MAPFAPGSKLRGAQALPGARQGIVDEAEGAELSRPARGAATNVEPLPICWKSSVPRARDGACAPVVRREARAQESARRPLGPSGDSWDAAFIRHDHVVKTEAEAMEALECSVLAGLGLPNPYQTD